MDRKLSHLFSVDRFPFLKLFVSITGVMTKFSEQLYVDYVTFRFTCMYPDLGQNPPLLPFVRCANNEGFGDTFRYTCSREPLLHLPGCIK